MNPDEAHGWEKLVWIQQGQIIVGKPDFLLAQSNLLGVRWAGGGHCLAAFQVFPCCSHSLFLEKPMYYYPDRGSGSLADGQHPEQGGKCSFSSWLLVTSGVPRIDIGSMFNTIRVICMVGSSVPSGILLMVLKWGGDPAERRTVLDGLMRALWSSAKTNARGRTWSRSAVQSEIFMAGKQLCGNGPGSPGGFSSVKMSCVLL